jgi:hypothetical protein
MATERRAAAAELCGATRVGNRDFRRFTSATLAAVCRKRFVEGVIVLDQKSALNMESLSATPARRMRRSI